MIKKKKNETKRKVKLTNCRLEIWKESRKNGSESRVREVKNFKLTLESLRVVENGAQFPKFTFTFHCYAWLHFKQSLIKDSCIPARTQAAT